MVGVELTSPPLGAANLVSRIDGVCYVVIDDIHHHAELCGAILLGVCSGEMTRQLVVVFGITKGGVYLAANVHAVGGDSVIEMGHVISLCVNAVVVHSVFCSEAAQAVLDVNDINYV
jgi:hypothetical protein